MTKSPRIIETSINIETSRSDVWSVLINKSNIEKITGLPVRSDIKIKEDRGNGVLTIGNGIFFASFSPFEIELNGTQAKIRIQIDERNFGCQVVVVAAFFEGSILNLSVQRLEEILKGLRKLTGDSAQSDAEQIREQQSIKKETADIQQKKPVPENTGSIQYKAPDKEQDVKKVASNRPMPIQKEFHKKRAGGRTVTVMLLLLAFFAIGFMAYLKFLDISNPVLYSNLSSKVSFKTAKEIQYGTPKSQIANTLRTNGDEIGGNRVVYKREIEPGQRKPLELISIEYSGGNRVKKISYLNLVAATTYYNLLTFDATISPEMTIEETASEVGIPFSLYRRYISTGGDEIEEVHFGYLDPTANFDPAWRGEFEVIFNRTKESVIINNWGPYDGADPSMIGSIKNTPFANQYDNYTDFLNDRFQFNRSQLLLNRYSLGDTKFFFGGEPVHYSNDYGYQFYSVDSAEKVEGTDIPLYRISIGYDNKGAFQMASFSNMRLYNKTGTLKDSDYRLITRGMTYKEVCSLMSLIPTSIYIDSDFYSVCYGRFIDTNVADEQFEVIIRFGLEDNLAHRVLINTAISEVTDQ